MCGRYALSLPAPDGTEWPPGWIDRVRHPLAFVHRYNIAPSQPIPVIRLEQGAPVVRELRWGLIPPWAKDTKIGYSTINARVEGLTGKPAFRHAWKQEQRCLIPALGWYEWKADSGGKQPYFLRLQGGGALVMAAGLWDRWSDPEGAATESATILTCAAQANLREIHERQPRLLAPADWEAWLEVSAADAARWLSPEPFEIEAYPVSKAVNAPRNEGADLIQRLTLRTPDAI